MSLFKYRNRIVKSKLIIIQGCVNLKGLAILYLREETQFTVKSLLREPQKDKKVDPWKSVKNVWTLPQVSRWVQKVA